MYDFKGHFKQQPVAFPVLQGDAGGGGCTACGVPEDASPASPLSPWARDKPARLAMGQPKNHED